ncbi:MAG: VOC family protein [Melioribacteraceae bacterium]|nr:VOC family protein [Melioribacteraceae bacterium]
MSNVLNWFEIPVIDMERAVKFYCRIFGHESMYITHMGGFDMAFFPMEGDGVGGALCKGEWYKPTQDGSLIYLNGNPDLANILDKVEEAGGKVIMPKRIITEEIGYMGLFIDIEGNRVALHSNN